MTRVPAIPADRLICRPDAKHIVVFARDQPFSVEVCDDDGAPLDVAVIEQRLFTVTSQLDRTAVPVGTLTGLDRDSWAAAREHLLQIAPLNRSTLAAIEDAVMVVALDETMLPTDASTSALASTGCDGPDELGLDERIVSAATGAAGHNRWFDKSMTLIVGPNGRAAVSGEHSPCDALIPAIVMDYAVGSSKLNELTHPMPSEPATAGWIRLEWQTDDRIKEAVGHAEATVSAIGKDSDAHQLWFDIFGVDCIRQTGPSPLFGGPDANSSSTS